MAGHSKFANIKHKKAKNDAKRGKIFTKLGREIAVAVRMGGDNPEENARLRDIVAKAKSNNMPNDTIERSIKKASGNMEGVIYEEITYEGYGPNGIAIIVETLTDNKNRTAATVRHAFTKGEGNLGTTGCVSFMFNQVGQIMVEKADNIDEDELMMLSLENGADDFNVEEEGYEIITSVENFSAVRMALEEEGIPMISSEITRLPDTYIELADEDSMKNMEKLLDLLEEDDDIQDIYHNWDE